jgi:hypothetical protein
MVMDRKTAKAIKRLKSNFVLCGEWLRTKGAEKLAGTIYPDAVKPLIFALEDRSDKVRQAARKSLTTLKGEAVDYLCRLWAETREDALKGIIQEADYTVSDGGILQNLICFLTGKKPERISDENLETCLLDREQEVVLGSINCVIDDLKSKTEEQLWIFAMERPQSLITICLNKRGWHPEALSERSFFFFLSGEIEQYDDIDFEQKHLRYWYETADPKLREAIASGIRKSGQRRLLAVFRSERGSNKQSLSVAEVELQIEILLQKQDLAGLFGLLAFATYEQGASIMAAVAATGWQASNTHSREMQHRLEEMMKKHEHRHIPLSFARKIFRDFRPMLMGTEKLPDDASGLDVWLADQSSFRCRSAALIAKAEGNLQGVKEDANTACKDAYWQVRMAAAACELFHKGTLSPSNRARLENDHVYWVQALLRMPIAERLVDLQPGDLKKLKQSGRKSDPKERPYSPDNFYDLIHDLVPDFRAEYLLILSEFLSTDVEVDGEAAYKPNETDIEIQVDK